jgi:sulfur-carrier protein
MAVLRPFGPYVTVSVRFFAGAQAAAGVPEESVTLAAPATLPGLVTELSNRHGEALTRVLAASSFIVDEVASTGAVSLNDGARVDVLPPFAGG